jgi:hypothetical protein
MSLDNVLAVAGAALEHPYVLIFGLVLSIALMGHCGYLHRAAAAEAPLDRLCRPADHPLRGAPMVYDGARDYFGEEATALAPAFPACCRW